jgi:hypothetical protein
VVIGKSKERIVGGRGMRPIKFRAWDKKFKKMYEGDIRIVLAFPNDDVEIMQFTGLKDKNGREIYQFDLWKLGDEIYLIVWKEGDWQTGWKKLAGDNYTDIGKDNAKSGLIIGNLLENPELFNVPSEKGE